LQKLHLKIGNGARIAASSKFHPIRLEWMTFWGDNVTAKFSEKKLTMRGRSATFECFRRVVHKSRSEAEGAFFRQLIQFQCNGETMTPPGQHN
jgi:hypothetical protein